MPPQAPPGRGLVEGVLGPGSPRGGWDVRRGSRAASLGYVWIIASREHTDGTPAATCTVPLGLLRVGGDACGLASGLDASFAA